MQRLTFLRYVVAKEMRIGILAIILWTLVVLALLLAPLGAVTPSGGFSHWDKVAHFGLFAVAGAVGMFGMRFLGAVGNRAAFTLCDGLFLAILTEELQRLVEVRDASFNDLLADVAGLCTAVVLCSIVSLARAERRRG